jgi:hypothetical protein
MDSPGSSIFVRLEFPRGILFTPSRITNVAQRGKLLLKQRATFHPSRDSMARADA